MTDSPDHVPPQPLPSDDGCLLTHRLHAASENCLTWALRTARSGRDEIVFLSPTGRHEAMGHVVLRDIGSGTIREPETPADTVGVEAGHYAATHGFTILGAAMPEALHAVLAAPLAERARRVAEAGGTLAAVAHRRFGIVGPIEQPPPQPAPPPNGTTVNGQDKSVDAWLDALGGAVSSDDKNALAQTSEDAQTLKSWFDSHKRGDPALNDMPQNVADAENRLLSNSSISQQIQSGGAVTRDALGHFINSLDSAANDAKESFQTFQKNNKDADSGEISAAAQASMLQADLPILDASGSSQAKVDGKIDINDVKAIANSSDSGVPDPLKQAAAAYSDPATFDALSEAGNAGNGLADSGSFSKLISNGTGFSRQDSAVHSWVDDLSKSDPTIDSKALDQIGDDATTLKGWFDSHSRGDPALNDMPQNVADAENRLLSNPAISKQIQSGGQVTRDALGNFLGSLDKSAQKAQSDWDSFEKSDNADNPVARQMAADADLLRGNLPVYDAAGSATAKTDNAFNTDDLKAIASGDGSNGLPSDLTNAAKLFSDPGMFQMLDTSGDNLATPHPDGLSDTGNLDNFVSQYAGTLDATSIGQMLSEAADRSMVGGVDTSQLGPDIFANPQNYSGAQKAAMIQQLQDLNTQVEAGVAQDNWVDTLVAGNGINTDYKQVEGDIAQKISQLSNDPDVQKFRQDNYGKTLQSIAQADPNLNKALQGYFNDDVQNGDALKAALGSKDSDGSTVSAEDGLSGFMQTANTLNLALGTNGQNNKTLDFQSIAKSSGQQDALTQAYEKDIVSGQNLKDAIANGTNMTSAIEDFTVDAANFGAVLPADEVTKNADTLQQNFSDTVVDGALGNATAEDIDSAFVTDGKVDTAKLTDAVNQAIKSDPDLGKSSDGQTLSVSQVVSAMAGIINEARGTTKLQDALQKYAKAIEQPETGPGSPSGTTANAYNSGLLHLVAAGLTGGVLAAKDKTSSGDGAGYVDATQLGASMQITGALMESGSKYLKSTKSELLSESQLKTLENSGKVMGGTGGVLSGALGIFSGVQSLKDGDTASGAYGIANGVTSLLGGVSSAVEGGLGLTGIGGDTAAAVAATASSALGIAGGVVGALGAVAVGLYEGISAAVKNVQFTNQFVDDAHKLGITGGDEPSNDPDPNTAPSDNSPPP